MLSEHKTINIGGVNSYLIKSDVGFMLIDTGFSKNRSDIEKELDNSGCKPGELKLIVLTHGDFDHSGNCSYFREKYKVKIAMHEGDKGMVEDGNLFYNWDVNFLTKILGKLMLIFLRTRLKKDDRFTPDIYLKDGYDFSIFGFDAQVVSIPGHSKGSVGVLTNAGDLFCGDLLQNKKKPEKNSLIIDDEAYCASVQKLRQLKIITIYPGHGEPFQIEQFIKN